MGPFHALRHRDFRRIWLGGLVSGLGDMVLLIALPFHVYNVTGSTLATGATFVVETLPRLLFGSVAGVFVDRWNLKRTMIGVDLSRAVVLLPLLWVHSEELVWLVYVVAFVKGTMSQLFGPAYNSLLPRLVGKEALVACNSLSSVGDSTIRLVGPTFGGAMLAFSGITWVVLVDAASYLVSAAFIARIQWQPAEKEIPGTPSAKTKAALVWEQWWEGLQALMKNRLLNRLLLVCSIAMAGQGIINVLLVPFVKDMLGGSALEFGWLATAQGLGGLAGGLLIGHLGERAANVELIGVSLCLVAGSFLLMVQFPSLLVALGLITLAGLPSSAFIIGIQSLFHLNTDDEHRGRIFGTYGSIVVLMSLIGMGSASVMGGQLSLTSSLTFAGSLFLLAGLLALWFALGARIAQKAPSHSGSA